MRRRLEDINELLGNKAYDSDDIRVILAEAGITATIPPRSNRVNPAIYDEERYKERHIPDNVFSDMRHCRAFSICLGVAKMGGALAVDSRLRENDEYEHQHVLRNTNSLLMCDGLTGAGKR